MISAEGLTRSFGGTTVVDDVSFRVEPGEVVGFLGPNGAGKSTTIRMLLGLLDPDSGRASITRPVGYLPENAALYESSTVRGQLRYVARVKGLDDDAVREAMVSTDVDELARRPISRLSKGQRQRVALAQTLLGRPETIVLDEPTVGLDPGQVVAARGLLRERADDGAAVLFSTHLLAEAATVCDRIVVLAAGNVVANETPGPDLEERFLRLVGGAVLGREQE